MIPVRGLFAGGVKCADGIWRAEATRGDSSSEPAACEARSWRECHGATWGHVDEGAWSGIHLILTQLDVRFSLQNIEDGGCRIIHLPFFQAQLNDVYI